MTAALRAGAIDAVVLPISEVVVISRDAKGLVAGVTVGPRGKIAWAVRKQDPGLRAALDDYLGNVRRSPSWSRFIVKYFGDQALQVLGEGQDRGAVEESREYRWLTKCAPVFHTSAVCGRRNVSPGISFANDGRDFVLTSSTRVSTPSCAAGRCLPPSGRPRPSGSTCWGS